MDVEVRLYGALRRHRPADISGAPHLPFSLTLPTGATLDTLCQQLQIPDGFINAAVNSEAVEISYPLKDGDRVSLFPPVAGGRDV
ncbi:MAG: MoaD/ThiS family protein [Chloroflexota bacterium]|jgi:molybdopterin converting factor small subunit